MRALGSEPARCNLNQEHFIHFAAPVALRPAAQIVAAHQTGLVVIRAEVSRARMGNIDRDKRDARLHVFRSDGGGDHLIGLEFDHQIHLFLDQVVGGAQGDFRLIAIIDDQQFDVLAFRCANQSEAHFAVERGVLPLRRIADAIEPAPANFGSQPVVIFAHLIEEAAMVKRVEQAKTHALVESGTRYHVAQPQNVARRLKRFQHVRGMNQRFHHVARMVRTLHVLCFSSFEWRNTSSGQRGARIKTRAAAAIR